MSPAQVLASIDAFCARGGELRVGPGDLLNPGFGYQATATEATPWRSGPKIHRGSGMSASAALVDCARKMSGR